MSIEASQHSVRQLPTHSDTFLNHRTLDPQTRPDKNSKMSSLTHHPIINGQVPEMDIDSLCEPTMKMFRGSLSETSTHFAMLKETPVWAFKTFIGWLYTQRLALSVSDHALTLREASHARFMEQEPTQAANPRLWPYKTLFDLYILGDKYVLPAFCDLIVETIQLKMSATSYLPAATDLLHLTTNTPPPTSSFNCFNREIRIADPEALSTYSEEAVFDFEDALWTAANERQAVKLCQNCGINACTLDNKQPCNQHDAAWDQIDTTAVWCQFHEHQSAAEATVCKHRVPAGLDAIMGPQKFLNAMEATENLFEVAGYHRESRDFGT
ncbi:Putative SKP1/BTB/POZ domain superfamily protein [Septoria linicola]|uniref:SKP1/BTB/POZ domain superfamily protein n=1 Tax=Septoria linicola TaxID=215465 RepID=A0A9Q9B7T9_9PEZI|nr:Putative SKP1/BTB/POZ domain superfamily protein [Septoria linicola]